MTDKPQTTEAQTLRQLLNRVMVGGNHLATHVDLDGPNWRASYDEGLTYYGAGLPYDAWCCWKTIMLVREDLKRIPLPKDDSYMGHDGLYFEGGDQGG